MTRYRVLHVVSSMGRGGAETLIMNVYRQMDRSKCQFDFITHSHGENDYNQEIRRLGGDIYQIDSLGLVGPKQYLKRLKDVMKIREYDAVHAHTDYQAGFPALAAKQLGIATRICHSHSSGWPKNSWKDRLTLKAMQGLIRYSATEYCSCSEEAAAFLFGKRKAKILKNSIDVHSFLDIHPDSKQFMHELLNIPQSGKVIGHIGRFSTSKNQSFLIPIIKKLLHDDSSYYLVLAGDGPLREKVEAEAKAAGIWDHIRFLGIRKDIPQLMNAFDVFLFPSIFEGFGIVMLEAQCAGIPCIAADTVPKSTDMELGLVKYISLETKISDWCDEIEASFNYSRPSKALIHQQFANKGFHINDAWKDWFQLYPESTGSKSPTSKF
ncbi:glycosyltransferase family 1 protein [Cytobacillus horneckiae]|nr:glycosyltransferase family 1 protein [Cytobacillus horneckiae]MEC1157485.1 glycosyltransferase family 1 protein [Cytobacillus horneckiae]MED2939433.1 glycosyltransferase family 1 protein [Cytobacillus horneckiae]